MAIDRRRPTGAGDTWFAQQLGDGWISAGGGIYYPPEPQAELPEPAFAVAAEATASEPATEHRLPHRRRELLRLRERLIERVARFPNAVSERQLRDLEHELTALARRLGPFRVARPS
ncbi:MAG TPA: hypothetical protein VFI04_03810 [Gaiellaceae bacterium]|nr:hypothetical protein [Gaiellaceae bacterium]